VVGTCYSRNSGEMFPGWWQHSRNDYGSSKCLDLPREEIWLSWSVAVYVRMDDLDRYYLRDGYLKYIGEQMRSTVGQTKCSADTCPPKGF
jgi:predicted transcriptional regulator